MVAGLVVFVVFGLGDDLTLGDGVVSFEGVLSGAVAGVRFVGAEVGLGEDSALGEDVRGGVREDRLTAELGLRGVFWARKILKLIFDFLV